MCGERQPVDQTPLTAAERYQVSQGQDPRPQQPREPPPEPQQPDVTLRKSKKERFAIWVGTVIHYPAHYQYRLWFPRTRALAAWGVYTLVFRVPSFLHVVLGGKVDAYALGARNEQCDNCVHCVKVVETRRKGLELLSFCGSCGCGQWVLRVFGRILATSEVFWKNRFANHDCPHGVHEGSQAWRSLIPEIPDDDHEENDDPGDAGTPAVFGSAGPESTAMAEELERAADATFAGGGD